MLRVRHLVFFILTIGITSANLQLLTITHVIQKYFEIIVSKSNVSVSCSNQLHIWSEHFRNGSEWAMQMLDATAKPQAGLLYGNIMQVGHYDECMNVYAIANETHVKGKYCTVPYKPTGDFQHYVVGQTNTSVNSFTDDLRMSWGICIPQYCSTDDLQNIWNTAEEVLNLEVHLTFIDEFCDYKDKSLPFSPMAIFAIIFFGIIVLLLTTSTIYDVLKRKKKNKLLTVFSLYTNGKKLFSTKTNVSALTCLNGIRVISMCWIILCHRFMYSFFTPTINALVIFEWKTQIENSIIISGNMAVDTFFTVSGLLVVYTFLMYMEKEGRFNLSMFYLHRILRLTPALAVVVLFYGTLICHIGTGPFWRMVYIFNQKSCERNWWSTLLYIQNYVHPNEQCAGHTWYLAVDTQLYALSPLFLLPLLRWPKKTLLVLLLLTAGSAAAAFAVTWHFKFGSIYFDVVEDQFKYYYSPTHIRMSPWLVGAITGYFIHKYSKRNVVLNKVTVLFLWLVSLAIMLTIVLASKLFSEEEYDVVKSSFFNAFARPSWAIALSMITFLCTKGYGGIINRVLSARIFTVLIRVNYSMYLLHLLVIMFMVAQNQTPVYFDNMFAYHLFWGDITYTVLLSILFTLAFESPVISMEKIMFRREAIKDGDCNYRNNYTDNKTSNIGTVNNKLSV